MKLMGGIRLVLADGGVCGVVYRAVALVDGWLLLTDICCQGERGIVAVASQNLQRKGVQLKQQRDIVVTLLSRSPTHQTCYQKGQKERLQTEAFHSPFLKNHNQKAPPINQKIYFVAR